MKHIFSRFVASFILLSIVTTATAQTLAFPGAEGFGRFATGGRQGTVYHVTNLNDTGAGSFRDAVSKSGRIIVFDVAGVIRINSRISVSSNLYIAGQTAPGEGITIYGDGLSFSGANNTICRYLRLRMGVVGSSGADALGIANGHDIIFDHCSVAWGRDEVFSISGGDAHDITIQNCIISQGLMGHSAGGLIQTDNVSIYRTLYIHNDTRNPKFKGRHQYVNNIVYNWKTAAYIMGGDSEGTSYANAVGNLFITGPTGKTNAFSGANARYHIYARDNMLDGDHNGQFNPRNIAESEFGGGPTFEDNPYNYPEVPTVAANTLMDELLPTVGASLPYRDNLDWMLVCDVRSLGTEGNIISDENANDIGAPTSWGLWQGTAQDRTDSDSDGMPDWWENANGTNPTVNDAMTLRDGYANIEHYINSINAEQSQYFLKAPVALKAANLTQSEITLAWRDFTDHEAGYVVEQKNGTNYTEIARTAANVNTFKVEGLQPLTNYTFRVRAFDADSYSSYSNELTVKTKSEPIVSIDPDTYEADLTWQGNISNVWDTNTDNWREMFYSDDKLVLFDEEGENRDITMPSTVSPAAIMVKGDKDYSLNGVIGGSGSVNMAGTGTLRLSNNNIYTGGTVVWGGMLEIGRLTNGGTASSIGLGQNWIWNGGTVRYTGANASTNREVALQRTTVIDVQNEGTTLTFTGEVSGDGDLIKDGEGTLTQAYGLHSYTGNTIVRGGTYELKGKDQIGNVPAINGKLILEGGRFRTTGGDGSADGYLNFPVEVRGDKESYLHIGKRTYVKNSFSGTGNLTIEVEYLREFYQGDWRNFYGTVTAKQKGTEGNQFYIYNSSYGGIPNARLVLQGTLEMRGENAKSYSIGALSGQGTTTLACCFVKTDGGKVTWRIGGLGTDETFNGKITNGIEHSSRIGTTSIIKEGEGYWRLTGALRHRGTTDIMGGTLILNSAHSKDKDHTGTYFTPGQYTIYEGATLAGKGSTEAPVLVKSGGAIAPGDFAIGQLTLKNNVTFQSDARLEIEVNRATRTCDKLICNSTLNLSGDLYVTLVDGQFAVGDGMQILSAKTYTGQFDQIIPAVPAEGLVWDTSNLYTVGMLRVAAADGISTQRSATPRAYPTKGAVVVEGISAATPLAITAADGTTIVRRTLSSNTTIPLAPGLYIVTVDGNNFKLGIRN